MTDVRMLKNNLSYLPQVFQEYHLYMFTLFESGISNKEENITKLSEITAML